VSPVEIEGRAIANTFWGKAWCDNLERYRDYEHRIERGRTYVRNGSVVDLQIAPCAVMATVSGSRLYNVKVKIADVPPRQWASICADCAGSIDSVVELLQGRLAKGVMERICRQGDGLFPTPAEIRFSCTCPVSIRGAPPTRDPSDTLRCWLRRILRCVDGWGGGDHHGREHCRSAERRCGRPSAVIFARGRRAVPSGSRCPQR
jgi:hypothetical protein